MIFTPTSKSNLSHILFQLSKSQENQALHPLPTSFPNIEPNIVKPLNFLAKSYLAHSLSHPNSTHKNKESTEKSTLSSKSKNYLLYNRRNTLSHHSTNHSHNSSKSVHLLKSRQSMFTFL